MPMLESSGNSAERRLHTDPVMKLSAKWFAILACAAIGCGPVPDVTDAADVVSGDAADAMSTPADAPPDVAPTDVTTTDVAPTDVTPIDAGPFACGTQTCGADQVCVRPCSGFDSGMGGPPPRCQDVPAACAGTPTCDCVRPSACPPGSGSFPGCIQTGARDLTCNGCA
jgi:hypothetical protein